MDEEEFLKRFGNQKLDGFGIAIFKFPEERSNGGLFPKTCEDSIKVLLLSKEKRTKFSTRKRKTAHHFSQRT
ncbi:hypothetical protein PanWU01x14_029180 [Parasponia andersonii]|uniref:Uncharacterized protein n=1 Tax=Parasponia andersonii TaxID=3476 RepID=A0A2P5DVL3_PARAD|nr:hypothetical protein PanWU01x14_029180 [Parasponia andersonii]